MPTPAADLSQWTPPSKRIDDLLEELATQMDPGKASALPRAATLHALLVSLQRFGANQLDFFLKGFGPNGGLDGSHHLYSPTYALDVTVNQIGYDLDLLLRASHQRSLWSTLLTGADQVAMAALQPAIQHNLIGQATVLTYAQKSLSIRLAPYAPVALVGLPFHATGRPQENVTIVHEVGHYVAARRDPPPGASQPQWSQLTRNGWLLGPRRQMGAIAPPRMADLWLDGWRDEIFADVYTCIVGGPVAATTLLELLRGLPATRWLEDDGEHPLPILRPVVYAAALRRIAEVGGQNSAVANSLCEAAAQLDAATGHLQMHLPDWVTFQTRSGPRLDLRTARDFIKQEVETLVTKELRALCPPQGVPGELWSLLEVDHDLASLDLTVLLGREVAQPPELFVTDDLAQIGWAGSDKRWPTGKTGLENATWEQARDELLDNKQGNKADGLADAGWNPWWLGVLSAGTWTTEGPGAGNPQPGG